MGNLRTLFALFCLLCSVNLAASDGWQPIAEVSSVKSLPQGVELAAGRARLRVTAIAPNVVRVHYEPQGEFPPDHSFAVIPGAFVESAHALLEQSQEAVNLDAGGVRVKILRSPLRVLFLDPRGNVISQDAPDYP